MILQSALPMGCLWIVVLGMWSIDLEASGLHSKSVRVRPHEPVSVVQNRYFRKAMRPELGLHAGTFLNESYTDTTALGLRAALFASEWVGVEVAYSQTRVADTSDRKVLKEMEYVSPDTGETVHPDPEINPVRSVADLSAILVPFYGKLNFSDFKIIYTDLYTGFGFSSLETDQGAKAALSLTIGQRFYVTKFSTISFEVRNRNYRENRAGATKVKRSLNLNLGFSRFLT